MHVLKYVTITISTQKSVVCRCPIQRRRSTLQYVVFVLDEKNHIEYLTRIETQRVYL